MMYIARMASGDDLTTRLHLEICSAITNRLVRICKFGGSIVIAAILCLWLDQIYPAEPHYSNIKQAFITKASCSTLICLVPKRRFVGNQDVGSASASSLLYVLISGTPSCLKIARQRAH